MSYETRKLSDIEFPMYFSLVPDPGYDRSVLDKFGIDGEFQLFYGYYDNDENGSFHKWGGNHFIKGSFRNLASAIN